MPPEIKPYTDQNTRNIYSFSTDIWPIGLLILWLLFDGNQPYLLTMEENNKYYTDYQQRLNYYYYTKLLRNGDANKGEKWLHKYLKSLYDKDKISIELYKLLKDDILVFDPKKEQIVRKYTKTNGLMKLEMMIMRMKRNHTNRVSQAKRLQMIQHI